MIAILLIFIATTGLGNRVSPIDNGTSVIFGSHDNNTNIFIGDDVVYSTVCFVWKKFEGHPALKDDQNTIPICLAHDHNIARANLLFNHFSQ